MNLQSNRAISLQPQDERTPGSIFKRSHLFAKTGKEIFNMLFSYPDLVIQSLFYSAGSHCVGRFSGVKRGRSQPARLNVDQRNRGPQDVNISHWLVPLLRLKKHSLLEVRILDPPIFRTGSPANRERDVLCVLESRPRFR